MVNLDATRNHGILENTGTTVKNPEDMPQIDGKTMTEADTPCADLTNSAEFPYPPKDIGVPQGELPYADVAREAYAPLADRDSLLDFLKSRGEHVKRIVRLPFGRVRQLNPVPPSGPNSSIATPGCRAIRCRICGCRPICAIPTKIRYPSRIANTTR